MSASRNKKLHFCLLAARIVKTTKFARIRRENVPSTKPIIDTSTKKSIKMVWCDQNLDSSADEDSTNTDADTDRERRIIEVIESVIRIFSALPPRAPPNVPESSQASDTVVPINEPCPEPTASAEVGSAEQSSNQKAPSTLTIGNQSRKRPLQRRSITNVVESVIARNKSAGSTVVSHQSNHNDDPLPVHSGMEVETAMAPLDAVNTGSGEGCSNGWSNEEMQRLLDAMKM